MVVTLLFLIISWGKRALKMSGLIYLKLSVREIRTKLCSLFFFRKKELIPSMFLSCDCCFWTPAILLHSHCLEVHRASLSLPWLGIHFNVREISFPEQNCCGYERLARSVVAVVSPVGEGCSKSLKGRYWGLKLGLPDESGWRIQKKQEF